MNFYKLSLAICLLSAFLAIAQSAQSPSNQSGTVEDPAQCYEKIFGSTPETRGKLATVAKPIHQVWPKYPPEIRAHLDGMVVLCVVIGEDGDVRKVRAISGPKELIPAAVKAIEQWRFRPFLANNEPVEASVRITLNFRLNRIEKMSA
jgi:TonB family protein